MSSSRLFASKKELVVADASAIISLNATGCAAQVLSAIEARVVVTPHVLNELLDGQKSGYEDGTRLQEMVDRKVVDLVHLDDAADSLYERLISGNAADTLDDGEAATIAFAVASNAAAMIDERKARRICSERHPSIEVVSAAELLLHPIVESALGRDAQIRAMADALRKARMRVPAHLHRSVVDLIGFEEAKECHSLPKSIRLQSVSIQNAG